MKNIAKKENQGVFVNFQDLSEFRDSLTRIENKISAIPESRQDETYITVKETADFLKCSTATVQRMKNSGSLQFTSISGKLLVKKSDIIKALEAGKFSI